MKNRIQVGLLLAVALAVPAFAQTSLQPILAAPSTTAADQSTASSTGASGKPALQPDTHEGFWGKMNPFARKKYVQRHTAPIRDRVNELDELTSASTARPSRTPTPALRKASAWLLRRPPKPTSTQSTLATRPRWRRRSATQATTRLTTVEQVVGNIDQYKSSHPDRDSLPHWSDHV